MRTDSPEIITIYGSGPVDHQPIFGFQPSATRQGNSSGAASPTLTAAGSHTHTSGGLQEARSGCPISGPKWDSSRHLLPGHPKGAVNQEGRPLPVQDFELADREMAGFRQKLTRLGN